MKRVIEGKRVSGNPDLAQGTPVECCELVAPALTNHHGTLYGVEALKLMGKAAYVCASRHSSHHMVMAHAGNIDFHHPVRLGEVISIQARLDGVGRSSMTIAVNVSHCVSSNEAATAISGRFVMVAVDGEGVPQPLSNPHCKEEIVS